MLKNNPLFDKDFLIKLNSQKNHEVFAKIIAYTLDEYQTEEISGKISQGSISIDGTSAIRRTCSLTMVAKEVNIHDFYWGLNTKFKLYIGLKNFIDTQYDDIIWFDLGMYLITSFNTSLTSNSYTISLSGKDKMCLLNGDLGGNINSLSVDFGKYNEQDLDGNIITYDYPIKEIIKEMVHQYAGEPYHKIIINDLDEIGFELMEYRGDIPIYMLIDRDTGDITNIRFHDENIKNFSYYPKNDINHPITLDEVNVYDSRIIGFDYSGDNTEEFTIVYPEAIDEVTGQYLNKPDITKSYTVAKVEYGQTCGYRITDLVFAGDLIAAAGDSITSVLDKIVQMLGDYEYFYNLDGAFVFQRKKTYVKQSWNNIINERESEYIENSAYSSANSYSFTNSNLITSFQNTPNLSEIKNDFSIWGHRTSASGAEVNFHLRYAIDTKPKYYKNYVGEIYCTDKELILDPNSNVHLVEDWREIIYQMSIDNLKYQHNDDFLSTIGRNNINYYPTGYTGYEQYYLDIQGFWRQLYNPDIEPIDIFKEPDKENQFFYVWDDEKNHFITHTFKQATSIEPLNLKQKYFYYQGIKDLETLIKENENYQSQKEKAERDLDREIKSLKDEDFKNNSEKLETINNIRKKYQEVIDACEKQIKKEFLSLRLEDGKNLYDLKAAQIVVKKYYPNWEKYTETSWKMYEPYQIFNNDTKYYEESFIKDLQLLDKKINYYYINGDSFILNENKTFIENKASILQKNQTYPKIETPVFTIGERYYTYEGFQPVSSLQQSKEKDIHYYSYNAYVLTTEPLDPNKTYFTIDDTDTNARLGDIVRKWNNDIDSGKNKQRFLKKDMSQINSVDKNLQYKFEKILTIEKDKVYYDFVDGPSGIIKSTPTTFSRGKTYFEYDDNNTPITSFTFELGVKYYKYVGYELKVDLSQLKNTDYYYALDDDSKTPVNNFVAGKIYYGFLEQDNDFLENKEYYITKDNKNFEKVNILKEFERGMNYYVYQEGYDKISFYDNIDNFNNIYVLIDNNYILINSLVKNYLNKNILSEENMDKLLKLYGIQADKYGNIVGLKQSFIFYSKNTTYREANYYTYNFFKPAELGDYNSNKQYYELYGGTYQKTEPVSFEDFKKEKFYEKLEPYYKLKKYDSNREYFKKVGTNYQSVGKISLEEFNSNDYYVKLLVFLTDEYNIETHWTTKMEYPETLPFWFDFLNINGEYVLDKTVSKQNFSDKKRYIKNIFGSYSLANNFNPNEKYYIYDGGELAQYSVKAIGSRPKTVNEDDIKAIYYRETPNVIFIGNDGAYVKTFLNLETFNRRGSIEYYEKKSDNTYSLATRYLAGVDYYRRLNETDKRSGYTYVYLNNTVDNLFSISTQGKTAFDTLNELLYDYAYSHESITLNTIPIYYLEPNTRIFVDDINSGINGEYIVSRISIPLSYNGTMSITADKAVENIK